MNGAIRRSSEDTRDNYQIMKDLVGAEKGPWYSRLAKRAVARVFTWTAPVVSYVSAKVASEISSKKGKKDTKKYRNQFGELFTNLLVKLSPKQETQAAAA